MRCGDRGRVQVGLRGRVRVIDALDEGGLLVRGMGSVRGGGRGGCSGSGRGEVVAEVVEVTGSS